MKRSVVFLLRYYRNRLPISRVRESGFYPDTVLIESKQGQPFMRPANLPQFYKQVAHHI